MNNLLTSGTGKSILDKYFMLSQNSLFDTVIIDDASLLQESEVIQGALRYGCLRLILLGNKDLDP